MTLIQGNFGGGQEMRIFVPAEDNICTENVSTMPFVHGKVISEHFSRGRAVKVQFRKEQRYHRFGPTVGIFGQRIRKSEMWHNNIILQ